MPLASCAPSPVVQELDALFLSEEILFPRPATDRKMVVNSLSQQNPKNIYLDGMSKVERKIKK
jgi:hypothetical protein